IINHQRAVRLHLPWLRKFGRLAVEKCGNNSADRSFALARLSSVEVAIISDRRMAEVHERFLGLSGPTDVITFQHGEIVISADTARANAARHRHSVATEIALYTVHGLLHLNGFEDATTQGATRMRAVQTRVMRECLSELPPP